MHDSTKQAHEIARSVSSLCTCSLLADQSESETQTSGRCSQTNPIGNQLSSPHALHQIATPRVHIPAWNGLPLCLSLTYRLGAESYLHNCLPSYLIASTPATSTISRRSVFTGARANHARLHLTSQRTVKLLTIVLL